ncbi:MAG TPA: inorganic diphosphatase [Candidatus Paceibacterota bacterium]|nr:inorganic diphosphatase [Candidatus Pacearchaeota archaeon]HRR94812.1 inorganic diphosphatase [Candidatus Paceibacterota bacterium]HRU20934.1 inorganic diphosphatase [Candidatus Paceibacterota bacterium]
MKINVFIENPKGSINKYEFDKETNQIKLDRVLYSPVYWPFEYGFIENTLSEDGDPLDVVVLAEHATFPGCVVPCKVIGMLNMEDEGGVDYKILAVPDDKIDPSFQEINSLDDLTEYQKKVIQEFFETYKRLEPNKWVKITGFESKEVAEQLIEKSKK